MKPNFIVEAEQDPAPRGWRGWLAACWRSLIGRTLTLTLRAAGRDGGFSMRIYQAGKEGPLVITGHAARDGTLTVSVEHNEGPWLKRRSQRP